MVGQVVPVPLQFACIQDVLWSLRCGCLLLDFELVAVVTSSVASSDRILRVLFLQFLKVNSDAHQQILREGCFHKWFRSWAKRPRALATTVSRLVTSPIWVCVA